MIVDPAAQGSRAHGARYSCNLPTAVQEGERGDSKLPPEVRPICSTIGETTRHGAHHGKSASLLSASQGRAAPQAPQ